MIKLTQRLRTVAEKVPAGGSLADIGSDHALLPVYLLQKGQISSAIAGELNAGPLLAAQKQVAAANLQEHIDVRQGNGLEVIAPGEADVITIAGMGGNLIVSILNGGLDKLLGVRRLILQPNVGEDGVRRWLHDHAWYLVEEDIVEEDGRTYEVLTADKLPDAKDRNIRLYQNRLLCTDVVLDKELLFLMGPHLVQQPNPVFLNKWFEELNKMERVVNELKHSAQPSAKLKQEQFESKMMRIKEVLSCLQKDKP